MSRPIGDILDLVCDFFERFVVFPSKASTKAIALFVAVTWVTDAFDIAPYLIIAGPAKRTGKSLLLELISLLVSKPMLAVNMPTEAVLYRAIDAKSPTLLVDEADAAFAKRAEDVQGLRAVLNAGYRRGGMVYRMAGSRGDKLEEFSAFAPKVIAGIGDFAPDTVSDRAITIRLQRKPADASVERFRRRVIEDEADTLKVLLQTTLEGLEGVLSEAWPELPAELDDRAQDTWEPLLAIADLAGDSWPRLARGAAVELTNGRLDDDSLGVQLLSDIAIVWPTDTDKVFTEDLLRLLRGLGESPWGEWNITGHRLARMLKPFGVKSRKIRIGDKTLQGWRYSDLEPLISAYTPHRTGTSGTSLVAQGLPADPEPEHTATGNGQNPVRGKDSSTVPLQIGGKGESGLSV